DNSPGVYRSTDSGETWTSALNLTGSGARSPVTFDAGKNLYVRVAVAGRNPTIIYALACGSISNQITNRLLTSNDGGASWNSQIADSIDAVQPSWNFYLSVDPRHSKTLYAGAIDLYKSTDAGETWKNIIRNLRVQSPPSKVEYLTSPGLIHVDQHALVFSP